MKTRTELQAEANRRLEELFERYDSDPKFRTNEGAKEGVRLLVREIQALLIEYEGLDWIAEPEWLTKFYEENPDL
jgi:hypothetical protein